MQLVQGGYGIGGFTRLKPLDFDSSVSPVSLSGHGKRKHAYLFSLDMSWLFLIRVAATPPKAVIAAAIAVMASAVIPDKSYTHDKTIFFRPVGRIPGPQAVPALVKAVRR